jgi:hypothetical protein
MSKDFICVQCHVWLGDMSKGKLKNGSVLLCSGCWERAKLAIQMADLAATQGKEALKGKYPDSEVVDNLMNMFGMKK